MKKILSIALILPAVFVLSRPAMAVELSGTVYSKGSPVANLTITVKETNAKAKTGPKGDYKLDLPPGKYTLVIRGKEFPVTVESGKTSQDVQL